MPGWQSLIPGLWELPRALHAPPPLCCFLLHIDLFTHSADMLAQGPSSHLYSHSTHGTLIKRLADRFAGITVNTSHQGTIHPPILLFGILDSLRNRSRDQINDLYYHRVPVPFWDRHPGSGPQFVVAERFFRRDPREDVIRWRRLHGSLFQTIRLYGGNTKICR